MLHWSVVVWMWCLHSQGVLKGWVTTDSSSLIKLKSYFIFLFLIFIILVLSWDQNKFQIFKEMCICLWARSLHDLLIQESFVSLLIMLFTKCWWLERNRKGTGYMKCVLMKQIFSSLKSVKWKKITRRLFAYITCFVSSLDIHWFLHVLSPRLEAVKNGCYRSASGKLL